MPRTARIPVVCVLLLLGGGLARAEEAPADDAIAWSKDLPTALARAKESDRVVMVCVNARHVDGRKDEEPAAKGLREVIYRDARVVKRSRDFLCVLLTPEGGSAEYGALRALGIDGKLVSPQHIFIHPDGKRILHRKAYWPYGKGNAAVEALLGMMAKAEQGLEGADAKPAPDPFGADAGPAEAPKGEAERAAWITEQLKLVAVGNVRARDGAMSSLINADKAGDCILPLTALMPANKKNTVLVVAIVRALGLPGQEFAALPIADQLSHRNEDVRGNAAVSLEYIGSKDKKVIAALRKHASKEKVEEIANHAWRALGRCGAHDARVRALLLKKASSAKSEFASYGPCVALAYIEGDKKTARGVEDLLKRIGVPGSRRGGGTNAVKRSLVSWTLANVGDKKSGTFVREKLMAGLEHVKADWVGGLLTFWDAVARVCEGEKELLPGVGDGVRGAVSYVKGRNLERYGAETRNLMDDYRKGRDDAGFKPKGDDILNNERGT